MFGASLLTLATLLAAPLAPQDATAAAEPAATDEVADFLADVAERAYDPRADGLVSLTFKLPIKDPMMGHTADVAVSWSADGATDLSVTTLEFEMPEMLTAQGVTKEMMAPQIEMQARNSATQFIDQLLGRFLAQLTENTGAGSMGGVVEGQVVIKLAGTGAADDPALEHRLFIDDESTVSKHEIDMQGQMGKQTLINAFEWAPSKDGETVVQTSQAVQVVVPMMGAIDIQKTTFRHQRVGDMLLLVEQTSTMADNPMMGGMGGSVTATVSDLVVNGEAVDVVATPARAAPEPAAEGEHEGAGDHDGHGHG